MTIAFWAVVALLILSSVLSILAIGKQQPTRTPGMALSGIIINGFILWTFVYFYNH